MNRYISRTNSTKNGTQPIFISNGNTSNFKTICTAVYDVGMEIIMIKTLWLKKIYDTTGEGLCSLDLVIPDGQIVGILGENGARYILKISTT